MARRVLHHHDGVVDDDADGQHNAEQREHVDREPQPAHDGKGADQGDWDCRHRNDGGPPVLQKDVDHQDHERCRDEQRLVHLRNGRLHKACRIEGDLVFDTCRPARRVTHCLHALLDRLCRVEGVGPGKLVDRQRSRRDSLQGGVEGVVLRPEFHAGDVPDAENTPPLAGRHDDVTKLFGSDEPALCVDRQLEGRACGGGGRTDAPCRHLDVLLADGVDDIGRREAALLEQLRVEPDPHAVVANPEDRHCADTADAGQLIFDAQAVVAQEQGILCPCWRRQGDKLQDLCGLLLSGDALPPHLIRQLGLGDRDTVLDEDGRHVHVGSQFERHRERVGPVAGARRGHIQHPLDTVDLLLDWCGDRLRDRADVGSRIHGGHLHRGGRDLGELGHWERQERNQSRDHDHDRDDRGKDRPVDEETRHE